MTWWNWHKKHNHAQEKSPNRAVANISVPAYSTSMHSTTTCSGCMIGFSLHYIFLRLFGVPMVEHISML